MRATAVRRALVATLLAGAVAGGAPAHAEPEEWVHVGHGSVAIADATPGLDEVVALVTGATDATKAVACTPRVAEVRPYNLDWDSYASTLTGVVRFVWSATGAAEVSTDCASNATVTVQITDYAPGGRPPVVRGTPTSATNTNPNGGTITAYADAGLSVVYYEPASLYQRGNSLVEIKVSGTYYNVKARATLPLGCKVTYTQITPTPAGPIVGETTPPENCA